MMIRFLAALLCAAAVTACGKGAQTSAATPATDTPHASAATASAAPTADGASVYNKTCALCHGSGAGGAPMVGVRADWQARIAQRQDTLYRHAIDGFTGEKGVMPAKGANASLSDDEVKAAVDYMQSQSQ